MVTHYSPMPVLRPFGLIFIFICLIYANTLNGPFQLDDYYNISLNSKIQINVLNMESIKTGLHGFPFGDNLDRPFAYLTFALNWLWGKDNVTGYHVVNIAIHIMTAFLLYLTIVRLLQTPNAGKWDQDSIYFIALLSTVAWAINPIQIQAVTYIVQRMASMVAMFYVMGILCYLKMRMAESWIPKTMFSLFCILCFFLGIASKNNAILLPVSLLLMEFVFFQDLSIKAVRKKAFIVIITSALLIAIAGAIMFADNGVKAFFVSYEKRPFTLGQRLLTQPYILLFYLSQIFYPVAHRFSIEHDIIYATSLFQPWYTFLSIAMLIVLICLALWGIRKFPILSFSILFFLGNHAIESTILPLEMIFEHRNYLPSFFLFVPFAIGIKKLLEKYNTERKSMYYLLIFFVCALMCGVGISTYIRNWDWRSVKSLCEDACQKAPQSARARHNLAYGYYEPTGQSEKAIELYETALHLKSEQISFNTTVYHNMAAIYCYNFKNYDMAVDYARKSIAIPPVNPKTYLILCDALTEQAKYEEALYYLDFMLKISPSNSNVHYLKAVILMKTSRPELALPYFRQCLKLKPEDWRFFRELGVCLTQMGYHERGYWFLRHAQVLNPKQVGTLLGLADNRLKKNLPEEAAIHIKHLVQITGIEQIESILENISKDPRGLPLDISGLARLIAVHIKNLSDSHKKTAEYMANFLRQSIDESKN